MIKKGKSWRAHFYKITLSMYQLKYDKRQPISVRKDERKYVKLSLL